MVTQECARSMDCVARIFALGVSPSVLLSSADFKDISGACMQVSVPQFDRVRVLVAGDVMLDRYWFGPTQRISPEAPVPVVHVRDTEERPGGAGNVAVNLASLGVHCSVLGITGDDAIADNLAKSMEQRGVHCRFTRLKGTST